MPFQDIDDTDTGTMPRSPNFIERALRRVFIEDWSLKLLALAITLVLWFAVTGQKDPALKTGDPATEKTFVNVPVRSTTGAEVQPAFASATLRGPQSVISQLRQEDIKIVTSGTAVSTTLELPSPVRDHVKLVSTNPPQFSLSK